MAEKAKLPKMTMGQRFLSGFVSGLTKTFILRPLITVLSIFTMWNFNTLLRRYPKEASAMASRILKIYYKASGAWVTFAKSYMEQLTGKQISDEVVDSLVGKDINLTAREVSDRIGREFMAPMLNMILPGTPDWDKIRSQAGTKPPPQYEAVKNLTPIDGLLGAERFLGVNLQFQLQSWMLHFIGDTVSMGHMKSLKDLPNAISWSYGIGWLSWLVMGTPFQITISDPLRKLLNMLYRPAELNVSQAIDAYNSGYLPNSEFWRIMREAGYEDDVVPILLNQGTTKLSITTLRDLFLRNRISQSQVEEELRRSGYTEGRIEHIITEWKYSRYDKILDRWAEEVIDAYEKRLIDENTLKESLKAAGWEDVETGNPIDLQVKISDLVRAQRAVFSKTEVRALLRRNLISDRRALDELKASGMPENDAKLLMAYWELEDGLREEPPKTPAERKLTKSELKTLYVTGIMPEPDVVRELKELGYDEPTVDMLIKLWKGEKAEDILKLEERIAELEEPEEKILSKSELTQLYKQGLIIPADVYKGLLDLNYSTPSALLLAEAITGAPANVILEGVPFTPPEEEPQARRLSKSEIKQLYENGMIDLSTAQLMLESLGYQQNDVEKLTALWQTPQEAPPSEEAPEYITQPLTISKYDIRRLAEAGKADIQQVFDALVRLGYNDFISALLTSLYTGESRSVTENLTPSVEARMFREARLYYPQISEYEIKELYGAGIINREEAHNALLFLGYTGVDASLLIDSWGV